MKTCPTCGQPVREADLFAGQLDEQFAAFWDVFPNRKAKENARKAFRKALGRASFEAILLGAERYARAMRDSEPGYIKHPATWLNNDCWLDEYPEPAPKRIIQNGMVIEQVGS